MATTNKYLKGDLPIAISISIPTALNRYAREDFAADYAIGNQPWLSAASDKERLSRLTTTYQKERIDQGASAGENSLSNWWLRSATSWHHGSGERYYDADSSDLYRFYESNNIDCWSLGSFKLLPLVNNVSTVSASSPVTVLGGTFYISNNLVWFYNESTGVATSVALPSSDVPHKLTSDGKYAIVGAQYGVYDIDTSLNVRKLWNSSSYNTNGWTITAINYVKDRIVVGAIETPHTGVYELSRAYTTPTPNAASAQERWNYSDTTLIVNTVAELNSAVIVGYTVGSVSKIQMYTISTTSPLAAIVGPTIIAELPRGETLNQVRTYLNEFVVLATSKGIRIGTQGSDGQSFTYGPLCVDEAVTDLAFDGSYVYGTRAKQVSGSRGLWRVDLGQEVGNSYAYNADLVTDGNIPNGVAFVGTSGRKFITASSGCWVEDATAKAANGYLKSGWIRFGTSEKKQPVSISVRSSVDLDQDFDGALGFVITDQEGNSIDIGAIPIGMSTELNLTGGISPADHFEVTFNLTRGDILTTEGPIVEEWQIRALPAPQRSRTFTVPLMCFNEEKDSLGNINPTSAFERLQYLERIEQSGGPVLFQDFATGEERICVIRAVQFEQTSPPTYLNGMGGIVTVQLQTIDTEIPVE